MPFTRQDALKKNIAIPVFLYMPTSLIFLTSN